MKIAARLSETGRLVDAACDEDWIEVHCTGKRPGLYCPDSERGCRNRLFAVEVTNKDKGTVTRFFRFATKGPRCGHAEVKSGVVVALPAEQSPGETQTGESAEHKWLKRLVAGIAVAAGYTATDEQNLPGSVRADVLIEGVVQAARVEVQRGPTDIPARTERYPDVVWLLRDAYSKSSGNTNALFSCPCVQVRITAVRMVQGITKSVAAEPWRDSDSGEVVRVVASSTVLRRVDNDDGEPSLLPDPLDLSVFLRQVWAGERRWYPRGQAHATFAGWALARDVDAVFAWRSKRKSMEPQREALRSAAIARAAAQTVPPPVTVPAQTVPLPVTVPARPVAAPVRYERPREGWWAHVVRWFLDG